MIEDYQFSPNHAHQRRNRFTNVNGHLYYVDAFEGNEIITNMFTKCHGRSMLGIGYTANAIQLNVACAMWVSTFDVCADAHPPKLWNMKYLYPKENYNIFLRWSFTFKKEMI